VHFDIPEEFAGAECIISNYERTGQEDIVPYGAFVLKA
jgi:hypothetical protein